MVVVDLVTATVCFVGGCFPALIGPDTPKGIFQIEYRLTEYKGYDGDVLQFHETDTHIFAIHRVYTLNPKEQRRKRLTSNRTKDRLITKGCINVSEEVYDKLIDCCYQDTLEIK